jgi:maltose/moltooligosaccharide transporter
LFPAIGSSMSGMILISGILLVMGAVSVSIIKETYAK